MKEDFKKSGNIYSKDEISEVEKQRMKLAFKGQQETEFSRYKQDCRKRAIEMAHADFHSGKLSSGVTIKTAADEYYEWLISIPE